VNVPAERFPRSRFQGIDTSEVGISAARSEAEGRELGNVRFDVADSAQLPGEHDLLAAFDVIHDLAQPGLTMAAISRLLCDDGVFLMGETASSSRVRMRIIRSVRRPTWSPSSTA
jgi:trans-aconitate methyltransferase